MQESPPLKRKPPAPIMPITKFGLLDLSALPADIGVARGRVCHDLIVSKKGATQALSKRPGYSSVAQNQALSNDEYEVLIEDNNYHFYTLPPHKRSFVHYDPAVPDKVIASVIHRDLTTAPDQINLEFYLSTNGGASFGAKVTFNGRFLNTYVTDWPYYDYEIDHDGTYLYIIFYKRLREAPNTQTVTVYRADLSHFATPGDHVNAHMEEILPPQVTAINRSGHGNCVTLKYIDKDWASEHRLIGAWSIDPGNHDIRTFKMECDGASSATLDISEANNCDFPVVQYDSDNYVINFAVNHSGAIRLYYMTDTSIGLYNSGSFSQKLIVNGATTDFGHSYRLLPELVASGTKPFHFFVSVVGVTGTDLTLTMYDELVVTLYTGVILGVTGVQADCFDLALMYDNNNSIMYRAVVFWGDPDTRSALTAYLKMRFYDNNSYINGTTLTMSSIYDISSYTVASGGSGAAIEGVNADVIITKSGGTYTLSGKHCYATAMRHYDTAAIHRFRLMYHEMFKEITIEALIQTWFEEDGKLQLTGQMSDNDLYKIVLSDAPDFVWEELEDDITNYYTNAPPAMLPGGRFKINKGVVRIFAGSDNNGYQTAWYGYIKRDFFLDRDGIANVSFTRRCVQLAALRSPAYLSGGNPLAEIETAERTRAKDQLGNLGSDVFEYRPFFMYDGFQFSLPNKNSFIVPSLDKYRSFSLDASSPVDDSPAASIRLRWQAINNGLSVGDKVVISGTGGLDGVHDVVAIDAVNDDYFDIDIDNAIWVAVGSAYTVGQQQWPEQYGLYDYLDSDSIAEPVGDGSETKFACTGTRIEFGDYVEIAGTVNYNTQNQRLCTAATANDFTLALQYAGMEVMTATSAGIRHRDLDHGAVTPVAGAVIPIIARMPATDHELATGDVITISGCAHAPYNGTHEVYGIHDDDWFQIQVSAFDGAALAGTEIVEVRSSVEGGSSAIAIKVKLQLDSNNLPINPRISHVGIIRRKRDEEDYAPLPDWQILGISPTDKGQDERVWSGKCTWDRDGVNDNGWLYTKQGNPSHSFYHSRYILGIDGDTPSRIFCRVYVSDTDIRVGRVGTAYDKGEHLGSITVFFSAATGAPPDGVYYYEIIFRWHVDSGYALYTFVDNEDVLTQSFDNLAGFIPDLDTVEANCRDWCVVNQRAFFGGVRVVERDTDDSILSSEVLDDTVLYGPQSGDGVFSLDCVDPSKYLNFGRGDGDVVLRIMPHGIGSDEAGTSAVEALAIIKHSNIYLVNVSGLPINWKELRKYRGKGALSRDAILQAGSKIYMVDRQKIRKLEGLEVKTVTSFERVAGILEDFTEDELKSAVLGYVGQFDWLMLSFPSKTSNYYLLFYDEVFDEWGEFRFNIKPKIICPGYGYDSMLSSNQDLDQKIFISDGDSVHLFPDGTDDSETTFTAQWISGNIGAETSLEDVILRGISAAHYTAPTGANGTVIFKNQSGTTIATLNLTASDSLGNHPEHDEQSVINGRAKSLEIEYNVAAAATRAELDAIALAVEKAKAIL